LFRTKKPGDTRKREGPHLTGACERAAVVRSIAVISIRGGWGSNREEKVVKPQRT